MAGHRPVGEEKTSRAKHTKGKRRKKTSVTFLNKKKRRGATQIQSYVEEGGRNPAESPEKKRKRSPSPSTQKKKQRTRRDMPWPWSESAESRATSRGKESKKEGGLHTAPVSQEKKSEPPDRDRASSAVSGRERKGSYDEKEKEERYSFGGKKIPGFCRRRFSFLLQRPGGEGVCESGARGNESASPTNCPKREDRLLSWEKERTCLRL